MCLKDWKLINFVKDVQFVPLGAQLIFSSYYTMEFV